VGVQALDIQHRALMKGLNVLHAASIKGEAVKVAGPLLLHSVSLANEHFSAEEELMESIGYPGLAGHRACHRELIGKIEEFVSRHDAEDITLYVPLLYFMRDWLRKHMLTEDQGYAQWIKARESKDAAIEAAAPDSGSR
jgi:hemerythrin-like metal-binding protein